MSRNKDKEPENFIVETYKNTLAGDVQTIRWWAHEKILVGGSILSGQDWQHLKEQYSAAGVLSVEAERHDGNKGIDGPYVHLPAPDDGLPKPGEWWAAGIAFMAAYFEKQRGPLYIHSQGGRGRAPAMAYACMRVVFKMSREDALGFIRKTLHDYGDSPAHKAYMASAEEAIALLSRTFAAKS